MSDLFAQPADATPLTYEETRDLRLSHISTRAELNEAEQDNILRGQDWAFARKRDILTEKFARDLHKRMLGEVWRWAGSFRTSERNLGINHWEIAVTLRQLLDDTRAQIEHQSLSHDEIAVRFHHRLVLIHPFPNGNGRHSRMMADLLVISFGSPRFTWGSVNLQTEGDLRRRYIAALKAADNHDYQPLLVFARS